MTAPSKRGLAWPVENTDATHLFTRPGSQISWLYNWSPNPPAQASSTLKFTLMQWNNVDIDKLAEKVAASASTEVLAFNEPELASQANMSPELAAREWMRAIEPLRAAGRIRAGSPGISSAPEGVVWLQAFLAAIRAAGGDVDFYALHWYGEGLGPFYDYIWSTWHQLGAGKPVQITEFACTNWDVQRPVVRDVVEAFCRDACRYLDGLEWVERYAWFGAMRDCGTVGRWARLIGDDGQLTQLGRIYRDC